MFVFQSVFCKAVFFGWQRRWGSRLHSCKLLSNRKFSNILYITTEANLVDGGCLLVFLSLILQHVLEGEAWIRILCDL